jgi:benzoyl-CoA reductase subunit B
MKKQKGQIWETRPLDCWKLAKEIRQSYDESIADKDQILGQGMTSFVLDWARAFKSIRVVEDNPVGAMMAARTEAFSRKCRLACEVRGWGREICGYHGNCWGAQFLDYTADGKPFPRRQFTVPFPDVCDSHILRGQQCRDLEPIPRWTTDFTMYIGERDVEREKAMIEHRCYNFLKMLNEMEIVFGQKLNDELLFEMATSYSEISDLRDEIAYYMTFIPAPLSVKDIYSFFQLRPSRKMGPDVLLQFWRALRDETKWRVENKIAAVGTERFRWLEAHPPPWHFLKYYRYMERYGAVCLGSQYANLREMTIHPDGTYEIRSFWEDFYPRDMEFKTREDIVRFMVSPDARSPRHWKIEEYTEPYKLNQLMKIYKCDGALLGIWRAGVGCTLTRKEQAMRLREEGYSVMVYEGSQPGDRNDLDEKRMLEQLDTWMESLGFRMLDDE